MITFLFILVGFFLIYIINQIIINYHHKKKHFPKDNPPKEVLKITTSVLWIGVLFMIIGSIFININFKKFEKEPSIEEKITNVYRELNKDDDYKKYSFYKESLYNSTIPQLESIMLEIDSTYFDYSKIIKTLDSLKVEKQKLDKEYAENAEKRKKEAVNSQNTYSYKPSDEEIDKLFSRWDGSLPVLKDYVKNRMNDPKSFEHVETGWKTLNDGLQVRMKFRGKNAYGAIVLDQIIVKTDFNGNILQVL